MVVTETIKRQFGLGANQENVIVYCDNVLFN